MIIKNGKTIACIAWIPIQIVAYYSVNIIYAYSMLTYSGLGCYTSIPLHITPYYTFTIPILIFVIIGGVLVFSNEYGSRKFWKKICILYVVHFLIIAVFLFPIILSYGSIIYMEPRLYAAIASILFPVFSLLGLMLVMAITRWANKLMHKKKNGNE